MDIVIRGKKHLYSKLDSRITGSSPGYSLDWFSAGHLLYTWFLGPTINIVTVFLAFRGIVR